MQKELAQRLLAATLNWSPEDIERYSNLIDNFAELKYDEYQQYRPGSRFVEHLCAWLNQFEEGEEREIILQFLLRNLTFISTAEMHRLIETVYPEIVLPIFKSQTEEILRDYPSKEPLKDLIIEIIKDKSAFFALSDGARIDVFRRVARLDHDQVCVDYSISQIKSTEMLSKMDSRVNKKDPEKKVLGLTNILGSNIINTYVILGLTALVYPVVSQKRSRDFDIPMSMIAGILVFAMVMLTSPFGETQRGLSRLGGILLLVLFCYFLYNTFRHAKDHPDETTAEEVKPMKVWKAQDILHRNLY